MVNDTLERRAALTTVTATGYPLVPVRMSVVLGVTTICVLVGSSAADFAPGVDAAVAGGPAGPAGNGAGAGVRLAPGGGVGDGAAPGTAPGAGPGGGGGAP